MFRCLGTEWIFVHKMGDLLMCVSVCFVCLLVQKTCSSPGRWLLSHLQWPWALSASVSPRGGGRSAVAGPQWAGVPCGVREHASSFRQKCWMESFYYKEQIHMCRCKALPRCGSEQPRAEGPSLWEPILSLFACSRCWNRLSQVKLSHGIWIQAQAKEMKLFICTLIIWNGSSV